MFKEKDSYQWLDELGLVVSYKLGTELYLHCPFHADSSPSLCVSVDAPVFFCQSCERGGHLGKLKYLLDGVDVIGEVSLIERLSGKKHERKQHIQNTSGEDDKVFMLAKMSIEDYFELSLSGDCKYFRDRGLLIDTVHAWGVKRSPMFLVFPIRNTDCEMEGLVLRALLSNVEPRYQNQPKGFFKKLHLFGSDKFEDMDNYIIVVEGPSDVMKTWQNGHRNVVGIFGSSIGEGQMEKLGKLGHNIFLLMDNVHSGKKATVRIAETLEGFRVYVPNYDRYKSEDPGACSPEELDGILSEPVPYLAAVLNGVYDGIEHRKLAKSVRT